MIEGKNRDTGKYGYKVGSIDRNSGNKLNSIYNHYRN